MTEVVTPLSYFILQKYGYKYDQNCIHVIRKKSGITPKEMGQTPS